MRLYTVADGIDLDFGGSAAGTAIDTSTLGLPFQPGNTVVACLAIESWAEAALAAVGMELQGSENETTGFETLLAAGGLANAPVVMAEIQLPQYIRWAMTSATAGDGRGSINLLSN